MGLPDDENDILAGFFSHTFDATDPRLNPLRELLRQQNIEWSEREERIYSDAELRSYPLLTMGIDRRPIVGGGPEYGTEYDLSAGCPSCGTGAPQVSPLMMLLEGLPRKGLACTTALGEKLVADSLRAALVAEGITGLELRQCQFYRNQEPLPWWQMISSFVMPKMGPKTRGIFLSLKDHVVRPDFIIPAEPPCSNCHRDGRFGKPNMSVEIVYASTDVDVTSIPDVVVTWECFGKSIKNPPSGKYPRYAMPILLMKPRVMQVFRGLKVKNASFAPVFID